MKNTKTLYIFRHGETEFNKIKVVQGQSTDSDLNDRGREQAHKLAEYYKNKKFDLFITSKLKRSKQTFDPLMSSFHSVPLLQMKEVNEISWGISEGKPTGNKEMRLFKKVINSWKSGDLDARLPGGESAFELQQRVEYFWSYVQQAHQQHIAVCTHGRTMRAILSYFLFENLLHMESFQHENTGLYLLEIEADSKRIVLSNDVSHLQV